MMKNLAQRIAKIPIKFYGYIKKDFLLLIRRKKYLYLSIAIPAVVALLFLFMLNPSKSGIKADVCDFDSSSYSKEYISSLEGFNVNFLPLENCRDLLIHNIRSGRTDIGFEIPEGFSETLSNLQPANLNVYYDNTDISLSNLISWKVDSSLASYKKEVVNVFNNELKSKVTSLRSNVDIALALASSSDLISKRIKMIDSDLKRVESMPTDFLINPIWTDKKPIYKENVGKDAGLAFVFPIISLFIILMLASSSLIYDKKTNFITRVKASTSSALYLLGKLVFFFTITLAQFIIILVLFLLYGSAYNISFVGLINTILMISMLNALMGMLIGLVSENEGIAILFSLMISFPLMLLSGIFVPIQTMPGLMQYIARIAPLEYQISAAKSVLLFNQPISTDWIWVVLVLFILVHHLIKRK
jgi:ABC-type multidrug transport system permease subunit